MTAPWICSTCDAAERTDARPPRHPHRYDLNGTLVTTTYNDGSTEVNSMFGGRVIQR